MMLSNTTRWSHPPDNQVVPSPWQATPKTANSRAVQPSAAAAAFLRAAQDVERRQRPTETDWSRRATAMVSSVKWDPRTRQNSPHNEPLDGRLGKSLAPGCTGLRVKS